MIKYKYTLTNKRGLTLAELLIAVGIIGIITPVIVSMLSFLTTGFTGYEAASQLRKNNQASLNRIYLRLGSCKRLFENETLDNAYLARIVLSEAPQVLAGSALPRIQKNATLAVGTTNFAAASVGNSLFFANNDSYTQVLSGTSTVKVDTYRFNYYYLTSQNPTSIRAMESYRLIEWRSVKYADANQISNIKDAVRRSLAVKALLSAGVPYGWDPSIADPAKAFFAFAANGSMTLSAGHTIPAYKVKVLTDMMTGIIFGGYRYGVSANSQGWEKAPKTVPLFGSVSGKFPGGFEVAVAGPSAGRSVLMRLALVAEGNMKSIVGDETEMVSTARDLW